MFDEDREKELMRKIGNGSLGELIHDTFGGFLGGFISGLLENEDEKKKRRRY